MNKPGKKQDERPGDIQPDSPAIEHTGQYLKKLRSEKGLTIKDVANATRISEINLIAIENQDFATLPADTFTRGFLAIYSRLLGIDPKDIVSNFMQEREAKKSGGKKSKTKQSGRILSPKTLAEPSHFSSVTAAIILLITIIILFTAFCLYTSWNPFQFLTAKNNSFQSIMMSVVPGNTHKMEPNFLDVRKDNPGERDQKTGTGENEMKRPAGEDRTNSDSSAEGYIENTTSSIDTAPFLLNGSGETSHTGDAAADNLREDKSTVTALSFSADRPYFLGDE